MRAAIGWVLCLVLGLPAAGAGDPAPPADSAAQTPGPLARAARTLARDQKELVTRWWPAEVKRPGFTVPLAGGVTLAATSVSNGLDLRMERWFDDKVEGSAESVAEAFTSLGNPLTVMAGLAAGALISRNRHPRFTGACTGSLRAAVTTLLWTQLLKSATARERPTEGREGRFFQYGEEDVGSFVSGHASTAFAVARVFDESFAGRPWVGRAAFGTAGLIALSRVGLGRHFPSDILVGGLLGDSVGRMVVNARAADPPPRGRAWQVVPAPGGLAVVIAWAPG